MIPGPTTPTNTVVGKKLRIFKEKSLGRSLGILVSGCVDIIANGRKAWQFKLRK